MKLLFLFIILFMNNLNANEIIEGNGVLKEKKLLVIKYDKIDINGVFNINIISNQEKELITVTSDSNLLEYINLSIEDNILKVFMTKSYTTKKNITINIEVNKLSSLKLTGTIDATLKVDNSILSLEFIGNNRLAAIGKTQNLDIKLEGTNELNCLKLNSNNVKVNLDGNSEIEVNVNNKLDIKGEGICNLKYKGNPKISKEIDGIIDIEKSI